MNADTVVARDGSDHVLVMREVALCQRGYRASWGVHIQLEHDIVADIHALSSPMILLEVPPAWKIDQQIGTKSRRIKTAAG